MTLRVAIVDDEPLARKTIRTVIEADPRVQVVVESGGGPGSAERLVAAAPDVLFLDIRMPGLDGFELLEAIGAASLPYIVFVTAYDDRAVRAFETGAVDYVLKPYDDRRLETALERAIQRVRAGDLNEARRRLVRIAELAGSGAGSVGGAFRSPQGERLERIPVRDAGGRVEMVAVEAVDWIEAQDYYACLHVGRASHLIRTSLTKLEARLDPALFVRVHRSAIVRTACIQALEPSGRHDLVAVLDNGTRVPTSRSRRPAIRRALGLDRR